MRRQGEGETASPDEWSSELDRLIDEGLKRVTEALSIVGIRVSPWTAIRWARKGVNGKHLEAVKVGGVWMTTDAAVKRFLARNPEVSPSNESRSRKNHKKAVESYLEDVGLGRGGRSRS